MFFNSIYFFFHDSRPCFNRLNSLSATSIYFPRASWSSLNFAKPVDSASSLFSRLILSIVCSCIIFNVKGVFSYLTTDGALKISLCCTFGFIYFKLAVAVLALYFNHISNLSCSAKGLILALQIFKLFFIFHLSSIFL